MSQQPSYASLCFLSYNRPEFISSAIRSAVDNAGYPCEVIVHDDGSSHEAAKVMWTRPDLLLLLDQGYISQLILHPEGHNEGVGTAINRMFKIATGDPVIKLDQDLLFTEGWLARVVGILRQDEAIGMLGLFKYNHEPVVWSAQKIDVPTKGGYHYTRQFCGSGFAIPRRVWDGVGIQMGEHSDAFCEDSEYMAAVREADYELALPDVDLCTNRGFGIGPSTVVEEGYVVHKIHHEPYVIGRTEQASSAVPNGATAIDRKSPGDSAVASPAEARPAAPAEYDTNITEPGPFEEDWTLPPEVIEGAVAATHDFAVPFREFNVGVVITTCAGREANLKRTLDFIADLKTVRPGVVVVVYDGCQPANDRLFAGDVPIWRVRIDKHEPGREQPRNVGFRALREMVPEANYVWFLDSDLIVPSDVLQHFYRGLCAAREDRILIGPYDWLAPGVTDFGWDLHNDPRWVSFNEHGPEKVLVHDLGAALANFGGNLIWPVDRFEEIGGFHPELHHGRCEDGELGLRAASQGVPMSFVRDARAWHVYHEIDMARTYRANERDVPLLNSFHPWVEGQGLLVTAQDGARFDWKCPTCGEQVNSLAYWEHSATHREAA